MERLSISTICLSLAISITLPAGAAQVLLNNALVISFDDQGDQELHIVKSSTFYQLEGGQVNFKAESGGNCTLFIPEQNMQVTEKCSEFGGKMKASMRNMHAKMGITKEQIAMMQKFGGSGGQQEPLRESGTEIIANVKATCFSNSSRKVCVSKVLEDKIKAEGVNGREMANNMAESVAEMGVDHQGNKQLLEIYQRGYPVLDMETETKPDIPGWEFLDDASQKRILAQMGDAGGGARGRALINVDKKNVTLEVPQLKEVTIEEMMSRIMRRGM